MIQNSTSKTSSPSDVDIRRIMQSAARWKRAAIFTHVKPDGDAIGSMCAVRDLLRQTGVDAQGVLYEPLPERFAAVPTFRDVGVLGDGDGIARLDGFDGVVIVDTSSASQLAPIGDWLRTSSAPKIVIDHHLTRDDVADEFLVDESAAATANIILDIAKTMQWPIAPPIAQALFVGIATDTGWFRHSNCDARALRDAAELMDRGCNAAQLFQSLNQQDHVARVRLLGKAIASLEMMESDRIAVMTLPTRSFQECGASLADTEDIVNEPLRIESVWVAVLFVEQEPNLIRVNLRSKPAGSGVESAIDVAAIAAALGGGGHARASGVRISASLDRVKQLVTQAIRAQLQA